MAELLRRHAPAPGGRLYDVGSQDVNGTYRAIAAPFGAYVGLDVAPGPNVDVVVPEEGAWPLEPAPLAISGQCLEHVRHPWVWIRQIRGIVIGSGTVILIAPHTFPEHRYPLDCRRIFPDGMRALLEWGGFEVVDVGKSSCDCFGVGRAVIA